MSFHGTYGPLNPVELAIVNSVVGSNVVDDGLLT
jgi:hypothetical protein